MIGWLGKPLEEAHWEDEPWQRGLRLVKALIDALGTLPKLSEKMKGVDTVEYTKVVELVDASAEVLKMLNHRTDPGAPIGKAPEFVPFARETLDFLKDFWDEHALETHVAMLIDRIQSSEPFVEVTSMLAARMTERMGAFTTICVDAVFGNYTDLFWQEQWAGDVCSQHDIIGENRLICGRGHEAILTQDAEKAFNDAVEAVRYSSDLLRTQVGLVVRIATVWVRAM
eukprot:7979793-Pyramimonas_sp.AAC.1